jgi:hypothetical protein
MLNLIGHALGRALQMIGVFAVIAGVVVYLLCRESQNKGNDNGT